MKKLFTLFSLVAVALMAKAQAPTLTVSDAELTPGGFATFIITSTVDASEFSAYQFDVVLPEFAEEPTKSGNNWVYEVNGTKKNALSFTRTYFAFDYDDDNEKVYLHQYGYNFIESGDDPTAKKIFRAIIYDGTTNSNFLKDKIKITLNFKVKDDIKPGKYEVTVENAKFATSGGEGGVATGASIAECVAGYGTYSASTTITYSLKAEYGTLILPFAAELPEGLTAYSCAKVEGNVLTLDEVESLAANTPYIMGGTKGDYEFTGAPVPADATPLTAGLLTGVLEDTEAPDGSYVLQNNTEGLGFYKVGSVIPTVKAYRCYLTYSSEASAVMFRFGGTTNIGNIKAEGNNDMYDILGRKVEGPAQKGVYIQNGKKVFVK